MGERALWSSKTAGGASRVRVTLGIVCKGRRRTLRVRVRPVTVCKGGVTAGTSLWVILLVALQVNLSVSND